MNEIILFAVPLIKTLNPEKILIEFCVSSYQLLGIEVEPALKLIVNLFNLGCVPPSVALAVNFKPKIFNPCCPPFNGCAGGLPLPASTPLLVSMETLTSNTFTTLHGTEFPKPPLGTELSILGPVVITCTAPLLPTATGYCIPSRLVTPLVKLSPR